MFRNFSRKPVLILIIVFLIMGGMLINGENPKNGDQVIYYILASSLASGQGYRDIYTPDNNPGRMSVLYPLLLSFFMFFIKKSVIICKLITLLFAAGVLMLIDSELKKDLGLLERAMLTAILASNIWFLSFSVLTAPTMTYLFLSLLTFRFIREYSVRKGLVNGWFWAALLLLFLSYLTRTIGVSLLLTSILYLTLQREYRKALLIFAAWLPVGAAWIYYNTKMSGYTVYPGYVPQFIFRYQVDLGRVLNAFLYNITHYPLTATHVSIPGMFIPQNRFGGERYIPFLYSMLSRARFSPPAILRFILHLSFLAPVCAGFMICLRKKKIAAFYTILYMMILLLCPKGFHLVCGWRYLMPVLPFIILFFLTGIKTLMKRFWIWAATTVIILNLFPVYETIRGNISYIINRPYISGDERKDYYPSMYKDFFTLADWSSRNTPENSVFMHWFPALWYLESGRKCTFIYDYENWLDYKTYINPENVKKRVREGAGYICVFEPSPLISLLDSELPDYMFTPITDSNFFDDRSVIYRVTPVGPGTKELFLRGRRLMEAGETERALEQLKLCVEDDPGAFQCYYLIGRCHERLGDEGSALIMYEKCLRAQDNYLFARREMNILEYSRQVRLEPGPAQYKRLGISYFMTRDYSKALENLKKSEELGGTDEETDYFSGLSLIFTGNYDGAEDRLRLIGPGRLYRSARHYLRLISNIKRYDLL